MVITRTTEAQIRLANASLIAAFRIPELKPVIYDILNDLIEEDLIEYAIETVKMIPASTGERKLSDAADLLVALAFYGSVTGSRADLGRIVAATPRIYKVLHENVPDHDEDINITDDQSEASMLANISSMIVKTRIENDIVSRGSAIAAFDISDIGDQTMKELRSGAYFTNRRYDSKLVLTPTGVLAWADEENEVDEFAEFADVEFPLDVIH